MTDPIKPSDPNQKSGGGDNKKRPYLGFASMLAWVVLLVVLLYSCQSSGKTEQEKDGSGRKCGNVDEGSDCLRIGNGYPLDSL